MPDARGLLIAFEGLDQSGKQTQAERLRDRVEAAGRRVRLLSFPDYQTPIGMEIGRALRGERDFGPDVMQLLYVANRHEWKPAMDEELVRGTMIVCDRYVASSVAYGEAQGLDPAWLRDIQSHLPTAHLTFLLDIGPEASAERKTIHRDKFERDMALLGRVRESYLRQADSAGWRRLDATGDRTAIADQVFAAVEPLLGESPRS
jgi:dTMP kinase